MIVLLFVRVLHSGTRLCYEVISRSEFLVWLNLQGQVQLFVSEEDLNVSVIDGFIPSSISLIFSSAGIAFFQRVSNRKHCASTSALAFVIIACDKGWSPCDTE